MKKLKQKLLMLGLILTLTIGLCACSKNPTNTNSKFDYEKMVTLGGSEISLNTNKGAFFIYNLGFGYIRSEKQIELIKQQRLRNSLRYNSLKNGYISDSGLKFLKENENHIEEMTIEERNKFFEEVQKKTIYYQGILRYPEGDEEAKKQYEVFKENFDVVEELITLDKDTYYYAYNTDFSKYDLTDKQKSTLEDLIKDRENFKKNIFVYTLGDNFEGSMTKFNTTTLDGEPISQDIFKDYDLTMVNIWATWCKYCVEEFPNLQEVYRNLPENVNMITLCNDGKENSELAKQMLQDANASFKAILPNDDINKYLLNYVNGLPTTVFLDKNGKPVGKPLTGIRKGIDLTQMYLDTINERLTQIGK